MLLGASALSLKKKLKKNIRSFPLNHIHGLPDVNFLHILPLPHSPYPCTGDLICESIQSFAWRKKFRDYSQIVVWLIGVTETVLQFKWMAVHCLRGFFFFKHSKPNLAPKEVIFCCFYYNGIISVCVGGGGGHISLHSCQSMHRWWMSRLRGIHTANTI